MVLSMQALLTPQRRFTSYAKDISSSKVLLGSDHKLGVIPASPP